MHKINELFFNYIFFPTAAIAYVVAMWTFIIWTGITAITNRPIFRLYALIATGSSMPQNGFMALGLRKLMFRHPHPHAT